MKKLIAALVATLFAAATYAAFADDTVKSGPANKPAGRSIDDGTVKSGGTTAKAGRAADEQKPASSSKKSNKKPKKTTPQS